MEKVIQLLEGATRPILTIMGLALLGHFIDKNIPYPIEFLWLVIGMVCWYFGDRTAIHRWGSKLFQREPCLPK